MLNFSRIQTIGFIFCGSLTAASFYFQFVLQLQPCALCVIQRAVVIVLAVLFLTGIMIQTPLKRAWHCSILLLINSIGLYAATRQVYLQYQPKAALMSCTPNLSFMLQHMPLLDTIQQLFAGSADCSEIQWQWLGLSMPEWTTIAFTSLAIFIIMSFFKRYDPV